MYELIYTDDTRHYLPNDVVWKAGGVANYVQARGLAGMIQTWTYTPDDTDGEVPNVDPDFEDGLEAELRTLLGNPNAYHSRVYARPDHSGNKYWVVYE